MILCAAIAANGEDALQALRLKAENGDAHTQFALGKMYDKGKGVPEVKSESAKWYRKAAEQGLLEAIKILPKVYGKGPPMRCRCGRAARGGCRRSRTGSWVPIDLFSVTHADNPDRQRPILDAVDNTVVTDPDPIGVL